MRQHTSINTKAGALLAGLRGDMLLAVLCAMLFIPLVGGGTIGLDDGAYYTNNQVITRPGVEGLWQAWTNRIFGYEPLTLTTIWLDLQVFGQEAWFGYRLHSLLWFITWILAVRRVVELITGSPAWGWCIAAICALHPVDAPLVLWPALRRQVVCLAFTFWALALFLRSDKGRMDSAFWCGLGLAICGIWARFSGFMIVAQALVIERCRPECRPVPAPGWLRRWSVLIAAGCAASLVVVLAAHQASFQPFRLGDSLLGTIALDGPILVHYLTNIVQPWALSPYYGIDETLSIRCAISWLLVIGLMAVSCLASGSRWRLAALSWALAAVSLAPCLNLMNQAYVMADHYLSPALPFILLVAALALHGIVERTHLQIPRMYTILALAPMLAALALGTIARSPSFKDRSRFLSDSLENNPESGFLLAYQCHWALGQSGEAARLAAPSGAAAWLAHDLRRTPLDPQLAVVTSGIPRLITFFGPEKAWNIIQSQAGKMPDDMITLAQAWHLTLTHRPQVALPLITSITHLADDTAVFDRLWLDYRTSGVLPDLIGGRDSLAIRQAEDCLNEAYTTAALVAITQGIRARIERECGLPLIAAKRALFSLRISRTNLSVWTTLSSALVDLGLHAEAERVRTHVSRMTALADQTR